MPTKRPWLKALDKDGFCLKRCKNPLLLLPLLIYEFFDDGSNATGYYYRATKLLIDGVEYNAPIRRYIIGDNDKEEKRKEVLDELLYLIDMHEAFYGD